MAFPKLELGMWKMRRYQSRELQGLSEVTEATRSLSGIVESFDTENKLVLREKQPCRSGRLRNKFFGATPDAPSTSLALGSPMAKAAEVFM